MKGNRYNPYNKYNLACVTCIKVVFVVYVVKVVLNINALMFVYFNLRAGAAPVAVRVPNGMKHVPNGK